MALRGATTCDEDSKAEIDRKTQALVAEMISRNNIDHEDLVSVIFTATDDLHSQFPATAARAHRAGRRAAALRARARRGRRHGPHDPRAHAPVPRGRPQRSAPRVPRGREDPSRRPPRVSVARIAVLGTGLIGGSIGLASGKAGTHVVGYDADPARLVAGLGAGGGLGGGAVGGRRGRGRGCLCGRGARRQGGRGGDQRARRGRGRRHRRRIGEGERARRDPTRPARARAPLRGWSPDGRLGAGRPRRRRRGSLRGGHVGAHAHGRYRSRRARGSTRHSSGRSVRRSWR